MTALAATRGPGQARAATLAAGAVMGCALVALVDPGEPGRYPPCPTAALLGADCPACGTLRGVHALLRGRPLQALDHNLLLLAAVPVGVAVWWWWLRAALGRPANPPRLPGWTVPALVVVAATFTVVRNLPVQSLRWLASS